MPFGGKTDRRPDDFNPTPATNTDVNAGGNPNPTNQTNRPMETLGGGVGHGFANTNYASTPSGNPNPWVNPYDKGFNGSMPAGPNIQFPNHRPTVNPDGSLRYPEDPYGATHKERFGGGLNGSGESSGSATATGNNFGYEREDGSPDYFEAARQQAQQGRQNVGEQTWANRPNQTNAWGAQTQWTQGPDGSWQQTQNFGGPMAGAAQNLQNQWLQNSSTPLDNGSSARDSAINAAYGQAASRLNPQWDARQGAMNAQLANQGLSPGSQAYRTAQQQIGQQRNDAYTSAMNSAIGQGTAAQDVTFRQNLAAQQYPLQAMQGMQGMLGQPGFNSAGLAGAPNYLGAAQYGGNYQLGQASNSNQVMGDIAGGIGQIGSAAINAYSNPYGFK